jgi:hypothetical protein
MSSLKLLVGLSPKGNFREFYNEGVRPTIAALCLKATPKRRGSHRPVGERGSPNQPRSHPDHDAALRHVAAEPSLHRGHSRQASGRVGRAEEGCRHRRSKCPGPTTVVEAAGVAPPQPIFITADRHGELSHGGRAGATVDQPSIVGGVMRESCLLSPNPFSIGWLPALPQLARFLVVRSSHRCPSAPSY